MVDGCIDSPVFIDDKPTSADKQLLLIKFKIERVEVRWRCPFCVKFMVKKRMVVGRTIAPINWLVKDITDITGSPATCRSHGNSIAMPFTAGEMRLTIWQTLLENGLRVFFLFVCVCVCGKNTISILCTHHICICIMYVNKCKHITLCFVSPLDLLICQVFSTTGTGTVTANDGFSLWALQIQPCAKWILAV